MFAPVVPAINDHELERVVEASAKGRGATTAGYVLLRLPGEVKDLFYEWLEMHYPDRAQKVRNRIHELRGGRDNDSRFGHRMRGQGTWAALLKSRFEASAVSMTSGAAARRRSPRRFFARQIALPARWNCGNRGVYSIEAGNADGGSVA